MGDSGWIKLHRQITDCWIWDDNEPYTKAQAWIYLLMIVNHDTVKTFFDGEIVTVNAGQRITSVRKLADKFGWSRSKVTRFLTLLEQDNMVKVESDTKKTLITVINYGKYQLDEPRKSHEKDSDEPQKSHGRATVEPLTDTNKNDKNEKNDNNPPISPLGEWDYKKHSNLENTKHILNSGLYSEVELLKNYPALWESIKKWMKYKDEKPRSGNHYNGDTSIITLLNKFVDHCRSSGEEAVIQVVDESIASNYQGIVWDKLKGQAAKGTDWSNIK